MSPRSAGESAPAMRPMTLEIPALPRCSTAFVGTRRLFCTGLVRLPEPNSVLPTSASSPTSRTAPVASPSVSGGATFRPLIVGAHYPGIERGLIADAVAARVLGGEALTVCTAHVVAGGGRVTDVLEVPSDTVAAQFEHLAATGAVVSGVKIGITGGAASIRAIARALAPITATGVPIVLDLTLSGPSGEDIADGGARDALVREIVPLATLVTIRRADAELVVGMEIPTLDDAQVAVQRLHLRGATRVLLRCGRIAASAFEPGEAGEFSTDLYYDGESFALFETPHIDAPALHGASSALTLSLLAALAGGAAPEDALQVAERFTADALRGATAATTAPDYATAATPR